MLYVCAGVISKPIQLNGTKRRFIMLTATMISTSPAARFIQIVLAVLATKADYSFVE